MKRDWSVFRITMLLYAIVVLLPINYYFARNSFNSMQNDGITMNRLVYINGTIQRIILLGDGDMKEELISNVDTAFKEIDQKFLQASNNSEYVSLFRANERYESMIQTWSDLKIALDEQDVSDGLGAKCWREVNSFSKMTEEMLAYKSETMLDRLYLSLLFTMLSVIVLVFLVRWYIRVQLQKHAIHDHVTGLYNKKYYNEILQKSKLLATRQDTPLSLLVLSFEGYDKLVSRISKKEMTQFLQEFSTQFREFFRQSDTVCRVDDNMFVVITPEADLENIQKLALRLENRLDQHLFSIKLDVEIRIGVATYDKEGGAQLLEEAQSAMQQSALVQLGGAS